MKNIFHLKKKLVSFHNNFFFFLMIVNIHVDRRIQLRNNGNIRNRIDKMFNFNCDKMEN